MRYLRVYSSPLGCITICADEKGLTALHFGITPTEDYTEEACPAIERAVKWLDGYFSGKIPAAVPPLSLIGTKFEMSVWEILLKIPYGRTVSYGQIARVLAAKRKIKKMSAQAVGQAVGKNPVAIIVPCHRVIGANRSLTGYAGGLDKKAALLKIERADTDNLYPLE